MAVKIAVLKESRANEKRVAMVPAVAEKLIKLGAEITMQSGAGLSVKLADAAYKNVNFVANPQGMVSDADVVVCVQPPSADIVDAMKEGSILLSFIYAHKEPTLVKLMRDKKITCFAMELVPRISRAQAMDALSSQAALAGYYGALLGATNLARILPMMTTAVGSIRPAKTLVMGLGVAGLQALATARRLGSMTEGYDVRPETKEQAESLGAKFVDTGVDARGAGGHKRSPISQTLTHGGPFDRDDPSLPLQHRLHRQRRNLVRDLSASPELRRVAVEQQSRPHKILPGVGPPQGCARVRHVHQFGI